MKQEKLSAMAELVQTCIMWRASDNGAFTIVVEMRC